MTTSRTRGQFGSRVHSPPNFAFACRVGVSVLTMGDWKTFLATVDMPPAEDALERLAAWLDKTGLATPAACSGLTESDLPWSQITDIGERTFCRRAVRGAMEVEEIKAEVAKAQRMAKAVQLPAAAQPSALAVQHALPPDMVEVMGADASACAIAAVLQHGSKSIDVTKKLDGAGAAGLGFHLQVDTPVWQLLGAESDAAKIDGRVAYSYVDLTSKALLPVWMPADAVGGKFSGASDWHVGNANPTAIQALERAMKSATQTPKFFRSLAQWTAVFTRYAVAAVAMNHLSWATIIAHIDIITRLSEEARVAGKSQYLAILYDDLVRRDWASRAIKKDPALSISVEATVLNERIYEVAKTRLSQVLEGAGVRAEGNDSGADHNMAHVASAESVLAKQQAAAEAVTRRAESATRAMAKQQEQLEHRRVSLEANGESFQSNREKKRKRFEEKKGNGKGSGHGRGNGQGRGNDNVKGKGRGKGASRFRYY